VKYSQQNAGKKKYVYIIISALNSCASHNEVRYVRKITDKQIRFKVVPSLHFE
jgi:hypothetical protein